MSRCGPRFIPTRVGNTAAGQGRALPASVHPHACGEYAQSVSMARMHIGSSPRVWGIPSRVSSRGGPRRFIPTRVGNTWGSRPCGHPRSVHPHACGEYVEEVIEPVHGLGSSPRVWGIRDTAPEQPVMTRFIPTRVGNTAGGGLFHRFSSVHPHACGEYSAARLMALCKHGSSPRVWGILPLSPPAFKGRRFIPTRVGNTEYPPNPMLTPPVHPHACGEYSTGLPSQMWSYGSSPRVWGILLHVANRGLRERFIPTRVGNTRRRTRSAYGQTVHPHACGEYGFHRIGCVVCPGSSPRVWGILVGAGFGQDLVRFIPTRVGNTLP